MWLRGFSTKIMYQQFCVAVFRDINEWTEEYPPFKASPNKHHVCRNILPRKQAKHSSSDLWFTFSSSWNEESPLKCSVWGMLPEVYFGQRPLKCSLTSLFYFGCCRNLHFHAVWPDIWHGNKIRQSVYKFTERQHLGFSQGINCWWDSEKHQKSILFSFLELHGSRSLKFLSLNDKTGFSTVLPVFSVVMAYMTADTQRGLPWCKAAYGLF